MRSGVSPAALVIVLLITIAGCGGDKTPTTPTPPITIVLVTISGNTSFDAIGQTSQLAARATLSNGMVQDQTRAATWSSSNAPVATVNGTGWVTATGEGTTEIRATYESVTGTIAAAVTLACRVNNTAKVSFSNRSAATTQDVVWDGSRVFTLTPGQTSDALAGRAHAMGRWSGTPPPP